MRSVLLAFAVSVVTAGPAFADYCGDREAETVFTCRIDGSSRQVTVCRHEDDSFQYAYGRPGVAPELEVRRAKSDVRYTRWNGVGRTIWSSLGIPNGDYLYEVSFSYDKFDQTETGALLVYKGDRILAEKTCRNGTLEHGLMDLDSVF